VTTACASRSIDAPPEDVYAVVSDPMTMARLSPELRRVRWLDGVDEPTRGARFRGWNRNGPFVWATTATVTDAQPGRRFAYDVTCLGFPVASWSYELTPEGPGTRVTESTNDRRAAWFAAVSVVGTGVRDRAGRNAASMRTTLEGLAGLLAVRRQRR
jgi:uncharacterized protein YndB with AHSA1/START domain